MLLSRRFLGGFLAAVGCMYGCLYGQSAGGPGSDRRWTGILISEDCPLKVLAPHTGTDAAGLAAANNTLAVGDLEGSAPSRLEDPGWAYARKQALALHPACRTTAATVKFSLLLRDGTKLAFDAGSNRKIASQTFIGGSSTRGRLLRVQIAGRIQNGIITIESIR